MTAVDQIIRWSTPAAVIGVGVAVVAAIVSYEHAYALVRAHGETGWTAHLIPLTVDGLIWASSMVMLNSARRGVLSQCWPVPTRPRDCGAATLSVNLTHGLGHSPVGAAVAAWPAVALVGAYELLMTIIRATQQPADLAADTDHYKQPCRSRCRYRPRKRSPTW